MNKLKSLMPTKSEYKCSKQIDSLEAVVGFQLVLEPAGTKTENGIIF